MGGKWCLVCGGKVVWGMCVGEERGCVCGGGGRCWEGVVEGKF